MQVISKEKEIRWTLLPFAEGEGGVLKTFFLKLIMNVPKILKQPPSFRLGARVECFDLSLCPAVWWHWVLKYLSAGGDIFSFC